MTNKIRQFIDESPWLVKMGELYRVKKRLDIVSSICANTAIIIMMSMGFAVMAKALGIIAFIICITSIGGLIFTSFMCELMFEKIKDRENLELNYSQVKNFIALAIDEEKNKWGGVADMEFYINLIEALDGTDKGIDKNYLDECFLDFLQYYSLRFGIKSAILNKKIIECSEVKSLDDIERQQKIISGFLQAGVNKNLVDPHSETHKYLYHK